MTRDRFGLPAPTSTPESAQARSRRIATLRTVMADLFYAAVEQVGNDEAERLWNNVSRGTQRRRGRPTKEELSGWDALLLEMYDELKNDPNPERLVRYLAWFFHENNPTRYKHASREALEKRIRRLIKDRDSGKLIRQSSTQAIPPYKVVSGSADK